MNSLSSLTGQPRRLTVGGKAYDFYPLTLEDLGQLQGWIDSHFPDPFDTIGAAIAKGEYNVAQQQYLLKLAAELSVRGRNLIGTPEADRLLESVEGIKRVLFLCVKKGRPDFTEAEAAELYQQLSMTEVRAAFSAAGASAIMADPKSEKRTPKPNGSSTSRRRRKS